MSELNSYSITFGKYKDKDLSIVLKDRNYCKWLLNQEWFKKNYEFLFNRIIEYNPLNYFIKKNHKDEENDEEKDEEKCLKNKTCKFLEYYDYFNLIEPDKLDINLTDTEFKCYSFYFELMLNIKNMLKNRLNEDNPFDIKAPVKWLKKFENETLCNRTDFKLFLYSYDLKNIPYIISDIKNEGGIVYKGAESFNIAKQRSIKQEKYWENILKKKYGEDVSTQFKYNDCIFDFLHINKNIIYECKLSLCDFNTLQYKKYNIALSSYNLIYIIDYDCIIDIKTKSLYTTNIEKYNKHKLDIHLKRKQSILDKIIIECNFNLIDSIESVI